MVGPHLGWIKVREREGYIYIYTRYIYIDIYTYICRGTKLLDDEVWLKADSGRAPDRRKKQRRLAKI